MKSTKKAISAEAWRSAISVTLLVMLLLNSGCATGSAPRQEGSAELLPRAAIIQPGDKADVSFTCWVNNGEVVAATDKEQLQGAPKSRVFWPAQKDGPVSITAVAFGPMETKEKSFEEEITARLAGIVSGMREGQDRKVQLTAQELPERDPKNYVISIARVRIRSKEMRMPLGEYEFRANKSPEVGQLFTIDPAFPGHVESITDKEVVIRFKADPGAKIETPFGTGRILEDDYNYKVDINAVKGGLVRSGPFVGRIIGVDENDITVDYRHPFGGETLTCDVKVEKVSKEKLGESSSAKVE